MPSRIAHLPEHGRLLAGVPARFIVFNARTLSEIVSRPQSDRIVIDHGRCSTARLPDYSELWSDELVPAE